jgi:quercetin dioxygenase-like cupin family protein
MPIHLLSTLDTVAKEPRVKLGVLADHWSIERVKMALPVNPTNEDIESVEWLLLAKFGKQNDLCPLTHRFTPGVYWREIFMPAGAFLIGHEHRTEHFNVILKGCAEVLINGELKWVEEGMNIVSRPGVRKILFIHQDMKWATIHANPDDERDIEKIEARTIIKSRTYLNFEERAKQEALVNHAQSSISALL